MPVRDREKKMEEWRAAREIARMREMDPDYNYEKETVIAKEKPNPKVTLVMSKQKEEETTVSRDSSYETALMIVLVAVVIIIAVVLYSVVSNHSDKKGADIVGDMKSRKGVVEPVSGGCERVFGSSSMAGCDLGGPYSYDNEMFW